MKQTTKGERFSYYLYFFGQNLFYMIIASYMGVFLLNHGISEGVAALLLIAPQIWDVLNDLAFGMIVDKAKLKGGKFLPWLKISWILIPVTTIFIFCMPEALPLGGKYAWVIVGYCLWSVAYTMCDTPIYALSTAMTEFVAERNDILSIGRVVGTAGCVIATLGIEGLYMITGWKLLAIGLSVVSMLCMFPILLLGKERNVVQSAESPTIGTMIKALTKNKYLLVFYIAFFLVGVTNTVQIVIPIFAQYVLGNTTEGTILMALSVVPAIVVAAFVPALCKKVDKFYLYIGGLCLFIVSSLLQFVTGYDNTIVLDITMILRGVGLVGYNVLVYLFTPDCIEYGHYANGIRQEGVTFSIQTFITKLSAALMNSLTLGLLAFFGFKAANADPVTGMVDAKGASGCWSVFTWVSAVGPLLAIIILLSCYKLRDKKVNLMAKCNNGEITREECERLMGESK